MTVDHCELTSFDEIVEIIENLRYLVREKRRRERLSLRAASAAALGTSTENGATLHRFEHGDDCSVRTLVALIRWVGDVKPPEETAR